MTSTFQATLENITRQGSILEDRDEKAVEIFVVVPLLKELSWNTDNIAEIYPQRGLSDGSKVDFDLQIDGESRIRIEVKSWRTDLDLRHEEQLADYCRGPKDKPELAALTNGRTWRLFLPPKGKSTPLLWFLEIDITTAQVAKVESVFRDFLGRERMVNAGAAVDAAKKLHKESQEYENTKNLLAQAWNEVVRDTNKQVMLVLDFAESRGIHVTKRHVEQFLDSFDDPLVRTASNTFTSQKKPAKFTLPTFPGKKNYTYSVKKKKGWRNFLSEICELMQKRHPEAFEQNMFSIASRFAETKDSKFKYPVGDMGIYTSSSGYKDIKETCYEVVTKFAYSRDSLVIWDSDGVPL